MKTVGSITSVLLALSIAYLASSIFYVGFQLTQMQSVVDEVAEVRAVIPSILAEVGAVRKEMPAIMAQVEAVRKEIPGIVAEVRAVRGQVPAVIEEVAAVRKTVPSVLAESASIREQVTVVLKEVETTREAIPGMLDRADGIVQGAENAGSQAGKNAATGFFTGIITAPITLARSVTGAMLGTKELKEDDLEKMDEAASKALATDEEGASEEWSHSKNKTRGTVTLLRKETIDDKECRVMGVVSHKSDKKITDTEVVLCKLPSGEWGVLPK